MSLVTLFGTGIATIPFVHCVQSKIFFFPLESIFSRLPLRLVTLLSSRGQAGDSNLGYHDGLSDSVWDREGRLTTLEVDVVTQDVYTHFGESSSQINSLQQGKIEV